MDRQQYPPRLRRVALRMACLRTWHGARSKLPVFVIAAIAGISLSTLDRAKSNYEAAKKTSIEVNGDFIKASEQASKGVDKKFDWTPLLTDPRYIKHQKFADQRSLVDALAAIAVAESSNRMSTFEKERRELFEGHERAKAELNKKDEAERAKEDKLAKAEMALAGLSPRRKAARLKQLEDQRAEVAKQRKSIADEIGAAKSKYEKDAEANRDKINGLLGETTVIVDAIHNDFGQTVLPKAVGSLQKQPSGLSDSLLKPILNQESSLYVIYQIFKVTALIILILSFLFVFAMAFRQLPLASGSDALTEQLRGLISLRQGGAAQEVARAAVFSVAAVGVGTAAVVAGNSIDRAAYTPTIATAGVSSEAAPPPSADPSFRNAYDSRRYGYGPTYNRSNWMNVGDTQPPPDYNFSPNNNIVVPTPEVRIMPVADREGTDALLTRIRALDLQVQQLSNTDALRKDISTVKDDVSTLKSGLLTKIDTGLTRFGDEASKANTKLGDIDGALRRISSDNNLWDSISAQQMSATNVRLDLLGDGIEGLRRDTLLTTPKSDGRNFLTRAGQFFGGESFAVSERSYESLRSLLPQTPEYEPVVKALSQLKSAPPSDKGDFIRRLREKTAGGKTGKDKEEALASLKRWESLILSFARLPR